MSLPPDDLTGAALVALMRLAFAEQGLDLPGEAPPAAPNSAHASLSAKVRWAESVLERHGPAPLLRVGNAIPRMAFDPIGAALLAAHDGPDLLARWARLERYVHLKHPIFFTRVEPLEAVLAHPGEPDDPPSAAMDYVLAGVIAGLLRAVGCSKVTLAMGADAGRRVVLVDGETMAFEAPPSPTGVWHFTWVAGATTRAPVDLTRAGAGRIAREAGRIIEADLVRIWSVEALAGALRLSSRTLQRRLKAEGWSLQALRRAAQIRRASALLIGGGASLSAIGFACGFADPAHFTRAFRQATGMNPQAYRQLAGRG